MCPLGARQTCPRGLEFVPVASTLCSRSAAGRSWKSSLIAKRAFASPRALVKPRRLKAQRMGFVRGAIYSGENGEGKAFSPQSRSRRTARPSAVVPALQINTPGAKFYMRGRGFAAWSAHRASLGPLRPLRQFVGSICSWARSHNYGDAARGCWKSPATRGRFAPGRRASNPASCP